MQNMEQTNSEILELTDAELEAINGGNWFSNAVHWLVNTLHGDGDVRRSTAARTDIIFQTDPANAQEAASIGGLFI